MSVDRRQRREPPACPFLVLFLGRGEAFENMRSSQERDSDSAREDEACRRVFPFFSFQSVGRSAWLFHFRCAVEKGVTSLAMWCRW